MGVQGGWRTGGLGRMVRLADYLRRCNVLRSQRAIIPRGEWLGPAFPNMWFASVGGLFDLLGQTNPFRVFDSKLNSFSNVFDI